MLLGPAAGADSGWFCSHPTSASLMALYLVVASLACSWASQSGTDRRWSHQLASGQTMGHTAASKGQECPSALSSLSSGSQHGSDRPPTQECACCSVDLVIT